MNTTLLIIGASVRAQVESALAAGFHVHAFDFFADRDLLKLLGGEKAHTQNSTITKIETYSDTLEIEDCPSSCGGILCGGIESRIEVVRELAAKVNLLGPNPESLARIRNMPEVFEFLGTTASEKIRLAKTALTPKDASQSKSLCRDQFRTGNWLQKKIGSSGGIGVQIWDGEHTTFDSADSYLQEKIEGKNISALFISGRSVSNSAMLGVSMQLVGQSKFGAPPFRYCGSIGPIFDPDELGINQELWGAMAEVGQLIGAEFQLYGAWGIDFLVNQSGVYPVDINPRLTGSGELYETAIHLGSPFSSLVGLHFDACTNPGFETSGIQFDLGGTERSYEGKAILFNPFEGLLNVDDSLSTELMAQHDESFFQSNDCRFSLFDIPKPGVDIKAGHPILTIRVRENSIEKVQLRLNTLADGLLKRLNQHCNLE